MDHYFVVNEDTLCCTSGHKLPPALCLSSDHPAFTLKTLAVIDDSIHKVGDVFALQCKDTIRLASLDDTTGKFKIGQFKVVDEAISAALAKQDKEMTITDDMLQHSLGVLRERIKLRLAQLNQAIAVDYTKTLSFAETFIISYTSNQRFNAFFLPRIDEIIEMVSKMDEPTDRRVCVIRLGETLKREIAALHMTPLSEPLPPVRDELLARYALCEHVSDDDLNQNTLLMAEKTLLEVHVFAYSMHKNMGNLYHARIELEAREAIGRQCLNDLELGIYDFSALAQMITNKDVAEVKQEPEIPFYYLNKSLLSLREFTQIAINALTLYQKMVDETKALPVQEQKAH